MAWTWSAFYPIREWSLQGHCDPFRIRHRLDSNATRLLPSSFAPILVPYMNNVKEMFLIQGMHWATPKVHFWPLAAVLERKGDQVRGFPVCDS